MKLLILSISGAGAGHIRVAKTLEKIAREKFPDVETIHADMVDYISLPMKTTVIDSYALLAKRMPEFWGFLYDTTNQPDTARRFTKLTKQLKRMNSLRLYEHIRDVDPDAILCTHFLPADIVLNAPKKYLSRMPSVSVILTDYDIHSLWLVPGTHHYFVATEKMKWKMERKGIPAEHVTVSGIPVDPSFLESKSVAELKTKHRIKENQKTILVLSGGVGMGKSDKIAKTLFEMKEPATLIIIAGNNPKLEKTLRALQPPPHIALDVIGWTDAVDEYMRIADVVVSKPGGLTTTECIALGKPLIVVDPIPGQEERNAEFILEHNHGRVARSPEDLLYYVEHELPAPKEGIKKNAAESILTELISDFK